MFSVTPRSKVKLVAKMLKAIYAQESKKAAREKAKAVVEELLHTNNVIERLNREIRRRTRVVGSFPDGSSALMLVCARLRHVAGTQWGSKK